MPPQANYHQLGNAILQSVQNGAYPESEDIVSADLPSAALPAVIGLVEQAAEDLKTSIREISRENASDINSWIAQAKRLQEDIAQSKATAKSIVQLAEEGEIHRIHHKDAHYKLDLLRAEAQFNNNLSENLENLRTIKETLNSAKLALSANRHSNSVTLIDQAERHIPLLQPLENTSIAGILKEQAALLRSAVIENLSSLWASFLVVKKEESLVRIKSRIQRDLATVELNSIVDALTDLQLLESKIVTFQESFERVIIAPLFETRSNIAHTTVTIELDTIKISHSNAHSEVRYLLEDLSNIIEYLNKQLPRSISIPFAKIQMPSLLSRLFSQRLANSIPLSVEGGFELQEVLGTVLTFADKISLAKWPGKEELVEWVKRAPLTWLAKRKESGLEKVRLGLLDGTKVTKMMEVEFVPTMIQDGIPQVLTNGPSDKGPELLKNDQETLVQDPLLSTGADDDGSAWGIDDDEEDENENIKIDSTKSIDDEDADDAWGWGEDEQEDSGESAISPGDLSRHQLHNSEVDTSALPKESYAITHIPEVVLDVIMELVLDAEALDDSKFQFTPIFPAAPNLLTLPTQVLEMYRSSSPSIYSQDVNGNLLLFNDARWLAQQLRIFSRSHAIRVNYPDSRLQGKLKLDSDLQSLESFAKRAYENEIETERTKLGKLISEANGFTCCTVQPYSITCEKSINSIVDRMLHTNSRWKSILPRSVLLQALGTLLSTITQQIVIDVEDMTDISEPESEMLTKFFSQISQLADIFIPDGQIYSPERLSPVASFSPGWLKFQYLANILESPLVDIKYLWSEAGLSLEFTAEEVVDLIEALFAKSDHRKKAIAEIRKTPPKY
ncbi:MAG: ribosome biogenesis protein ytm1 [Trizodia sp. TS-e1964]|nr:MAG: ribosome biogenesis protein ytm1 [Trizodia sp. TS-e1964]